MWTPSHPCGTRRRISAVSSRVVQPADSTLHPRAMPNRAGANVDVLLAIAVVQLAERPCIARRPRWHHLREDASRRDPERGAHPAVGSSSADPPGNWLPDTLTPHESSTAAIVPLVNGTVLPVIVPVSV